MFTSILKHDFLGKRKFSESNSPLTTFLKILVFSSNLTYSVRVSKQTEYLTYADRVPNYPDSVPNLRRQSIHATQAAYLTYANRVHNLLRQSS